MFKSMENSKKFVKSKFFGTSDVYIGHVPKILPKGKIEQVFSKYGVLVDVLYRFGNGSYGYVIVKFKYQKDADAVLRDVDKINICGFEMDVRRGKINTPPILENANGATGMVKTVTFAEPLLVETPNFMEPMLYGDCNYAAAFPPTETEQFPVMIEIICTNVENAVTFYGCISNRYGELENLSLKLNSICPNLQRLLRKPALKKVYGALYEDMAWYRCSVIQCAVPSKPGLCIVQYIDYGNIAEVSYTNMVELPEPLKNLTPFAVKCVFSNLMCSPKSHNNISYLHHLVNHRMSLCALSSWGIAEYQVLKCTCNGIDVIAELVRNGFAVYKTLMPMKSPPLPNRPKVTNSKLQENHKPKKAGNKTQKKGGDASNGNKKSKDVCNSKKHVGDACNGVDEHCTEINNNEDHKKTCNSLSPDRSHTQEFVPKKIIKRGSDITDASTHPILRGAETVNRVLKMDCVVSNWKLLKNIRCLSPSHTNDDLINNSINLLHEINEIKASDTKRVEEAYQKYCDSLKNLKECNNQELLADLKKKREKQKNELRSELQHFFEVFDYSLFDKRKRIQEMITNLESNSNAWMNVYLSKPPETLDDLLKAYDQEKEKKKSIIQKAREKTNEKIQNFQDVLGDLKTEFSLDVVDGDVNETCFDNTGGKRGSWSLKLDEILTEIGVACEEEMNVSTMVKDRNQVSVIDCILERLDIPKERIDFECELFKKYKTLYDELNSLSDLNDTFEKLHTSQQEIQTVSSKCVLNGDYEKLNNSLLKLHTALLQEDDLLQYLSKASVLHFPELILEHPDLKLDEYQKNSNLLKFSWDVKFFPRFGKCIRIEPSYISKLADEPIVIKEFRISCDSEKKAFLKKAVTWNEIKSESLVKVKALFSNKDENALYAVLPPVWETLFDKPLSVPVDYKMALSLLQQILAGLCDIHSRGIAHGAVHPVAILHKDGAVLLDFNFDRKYLGENSCLNGINFQVPCAEDLYKSADMYGFGCLVLWVLFPNLAFTSTDQEVPNLSSFQSIIQDLLSVKDFAALSALVNVNQDLRPSSRVLLSNGFLKELRIMS